MPSKTVNVGSAGKWKIDVTLVSQSQAGWTSTIRVRCYMENTSGVTSFVNNPPGVAMSINGPGSHDWSDGSVGFNVSGGATDLVVDETFVVTHAANGTLSTSWTATLGSTGTGTFGSGGAATVSYSPPSLATVPGAPTKPTITDILDDTATVDSNDGTTGGLTITGRRIYYNTSNTTTGASYVDADSGGTAVLTDLLNPKTPYWVWGRRANSEGWGAYSIVNTFTTFAVPEAPTTVACTIFRQTSFSFSFTDGADNGSPITGRELAYSLTDGGTKTSVSVPGNSGILSGLPDTLAGQTIYIYARIQNAYGWSNYSLVSVITLLAGAIVWVDGIPHPAVPYLKVAGVWKLVEPWVKRSGVWKQTVK